MQSVGEVIKQHNIELDTIDPVARGGFTQVPNFIMRNPWLSPGEKVTYGLFLSYAWHNDFCFPGQDRMAKDMGMSVSRVNEFVKSLTAPQFRIEGRYAITAVGPGHHQGRLWFQ